MDCRVCVREGTCVRYKTPQEQGCFQLETPSVGCHGLYMQREGYTGMRRCDGIGI
jgi:hypothetical protein